MHYKHLGKLSPGTYAVGRLRGDHWAGFRCSHCQFVWVIFAQTSKAESKRTTCRVCKKTGTYRYHIAKPEVK